ncbi:MAG: hypothetical protein IH795_10635, partial [Bacteroidetes bacterium]|nr:hypothetical protein [Bacteroidota bacterium]
MYITMWSDPDIGDASDDYAGSDTTLNMVYAYNASEFDAVYYPYSPPAVGFTLLKGPSVTGTFNLPMTAAYYTAAFSSLPGLFSADFWYHLMEGTTGLTGDPFVNPITGLTTTYALSGDPITGEGWIDGILNDPGDRRIGLASGPFNMAIGDTQEVVIAEIAAIGLDNLNAFKILRFYNVLAQDAFDNGLDINPISPPIPPTPVVTVNDANWVIKLNWGTDTTSVNTIENFDQGGYAFQGYNVYQLASPLPIKENAVRVATFDKIDGITGIPGIVMDPETGLPINGIQQNGSDSGIERMFSTHHDYIKNEDMKVGKKYYFAVTAYTYNSDPQANPNNSESLINIIEAVFYDSHPGAYYGDSIFVTHSAGMADGNIYVTIDDPTQLTGHDYEVFFETQQQIRDENGDWVPASIIKRNFNPDDPDTLTGTTIDVAAVYSTTAGSIELRFHLDVVHHYYGWVDGVILTFPASVTIIDSPPFEA